MRPSFWNRSVRVLVLLASIVALSVPRPSFAASGGGGRTRLEVGSFNIQVFGESKFSKPFIRQAILSIISRYDIIFIQEIRDDKNKAIFELLKELNADTGRNYHALVSTRMGRGEMKEQYAYFFDSKIVKPLDSYVFNDVQDQFSREPYIARFAALGRTFTLAGIHVAPTDVRAELRALKEVHRDVKKRFHDDNLLIMGDFNADCLYYKPAEGFDFFDEKVTLLVGDDEDTTVSPSSCAYDRVLGFGSFLEHVSEAKAFNFQEVFQYDLESSKLISDHYPIEFTIESSGDQVSENENSTGEEAPAPTPSETQSAAASTDLEPSSLPEPTHESQMSSDGAVCGLSPYTTPAGYCYAIFETNKKRRVPRSCCPS
jgi:deoxyribonuclease-1-like protein